MSADLLRPRDAARPVAVVHPGRQHAYEAALAAQDAGLLRAFVTAIYDTRTGWFDRRWQRWLSQDARARIDARLASWRHGDLDPALVRTTPAYDLVARAVTASAIPWLSDAQRRTVLRRAGDRVDASAARWVRRQRGLRIVHGFEGASLRTLHAARRSGAVTVLDVPAAHDYARRLLRDDPDVDAHDGVTRQVHAERALADFLLAPSEWVASELRDHGVAADRIVTVPYGVDAQAFTPGPGGEPDGVFRVLFVGLVGRRKGTDQLIEAWRRLALPHAELVLVGHAGQSGDVLRDLPLAGVRWVGKVPGAAVHEWYRTSDVFAFPSRSEGSALVTYEALASGLPVVTTRNAGSVVRDGREGFIVPVEDPGALAARIRELYERPDLRRAMGRAGRETIENAYTWRHYRSRLGALYRAILDGAPPQAAVAALPGGRPGD